MDMSVLPATTISPVRQIAKLLLLMGKETGLVKLIALCFPVAAVMSLEVETFTTTSRLKDQTFIRMAPPMPSFAGSPPLR